MNTIEFEFNIDENKIPYIYPLVYDLSGTITLYESETANKFKSADLPITITVEYGYDRHRRMKISFLAFNVTAKLDSPILLRDNSYKSILEKCLVKVDNKYAGFYKQVIPNNPNREYPVYQILESILVYDNCYRYSWRGFSVIFYGRGDSEKFIIIFGDKVIDDNGSEIQKLLDDMDNGTAPSEFYLEQSISKMKSSRK